MVLKHLSWEHFILMEMFLKVWRCIATMQRQSGRTSQRKHDLLSGTIHNFLEFMTLNVNLVQHLLAVDGDNFVVVFSIILVEEEPDKTMLWTDDEGSLLLHLTAVPNGVVQLVKTKLLYAVLAFHPHHKLFVFDTVLLLKQRLFVGPLHDVLHFFSHQTSGSTIIHQVVVVNHELLHRYFAIVVVVDVLHLHVDKHAQLLRREEISYSHVLQEQAQLLPIKITFFVVIIASKLESYELILDFTNLHT
mmetsp:Transcript_32614/g.45256  ORF Transcript_32614/g.45256 Transcript_32614/m.45256 type:complete len:247 (-) Transcript_32614:121-861(-)